MPSSEIRTSTDARNRPAKLAQEPAPVDPYVETTDPEVYVEAEINTTLRDIAREAIAVICV